jgi:hypothetical protein
MSEQGNKMLGEFACMESSCLIRTQKSQITSALSHVQVLLGFKGRTYLVQVSLSISHLNHEVMQRYISQTPFGVINQPSPAKDIPSIPIRETPAQPDHAT